MPVTIRLCNAQIKLPCILCITKEWLHLPKDRPACTLEALGQAGSSLLQLRRSHSDSWCNPGANQSGLRLWTACFRINILPGSQARWFVMSVFHDWRYSISCRYSLPKCSIWKSRCFGKNGSVAFIYVYLDSHGELKRFLCNALNSFTTKLSEKKPWAFLSYKISQLLPNFPSRNMAIFLPLHPTFLENFNIKTKAKNLLLLLSYIYSSYYTCAVLRCIWKHAECSRIGEFRTSP